MHSARIQILVALSVTLSACGRDSTAPTTSPLRAVQSVAPSAATDSEIMGELPDIARINNRLATNGIHARLNAVHLMVSRDYPPGAPTVYVADRTRYLPSQYVEHDPRRRTDVGLQWTYDTRRGAALTLVNDVEAPWTASQSVEMARTDVNTWARLPCYKANFSQVPYPISPDNLNIEIADDFYLGGETQPFAPVAEITFGGFLPYTVFRQIYGGLAGDDILGISFQYVFADANGPTDIDHNGLGDRAWSEIYFNSLYYVQDATLPGSDPLVEDLGTTGLHEAGHAFGLGHFGTIFENHGGLKYAAGNIMTALIHGVNRSVSGEPTSAFCDLYGRWK